MVLRHHPEGFRHNRLGERFGLEFRLAEGRHLMVAVSRGHRWQCAAGGVSAIPRDGAELLEPSPRDQLVDARAGGDQVDGAVPRVVVAVRLVATRTETASRGK